jgi:hypothetical protein
MAYIDWTQDSVYEQQNQYDELDTYLRAVYESAGMSMSCHGTRLRSFQAADVFSRTVFHSAGTGLASLE